MVSCATGYVPDQDLPALYRGAALFAYPSLYEGFGLPVLEAMTAGTAVLTSNTSSLPEVAGDAAVYCDPWQVRSIAAALERGLTDEALRVRLAAAGSERARDFSWKRHAAETLAIAERGRGRRGVLRTGPCRAGSPPPCCPSAPSARTSDGWCPLAHARRPAPRVSICDVMAAPCGMARSPAWSIPTSWRSAAWSASCWAGTSMKPAPVVAEWVRLAPGHIVNVGCAEGYYAVGFALAVPGATVYAFDLDPDARGRCEQLSRANGVAERVRIAGECTPDALAGLPETGVTLFCDCEGCEVALLDPARVPRLRAWPVCVELHEFIDPAIGATLAGRFSPTHAVELIDQAPATTGRAIPELAGFSERERFVLLDEFRPAQMRWGVMRPRRSKSSD